MTMWPEKPGVRVHSGAVHSVVPAELRAWGKYERYRDLMLWQLAWAVSDRHADKEYDALARSPGLRPTAGDQAEQLGASRPEPTPHPDAASVVRAALGPAPTGGRTRRAIVGTRHG